MKLEIELQMDNAAFEPVWEDEAVVILCKLGLRIKSGEIFPMKLRDTNGNTVGECRLIGGTR